MKTAISVEDDVLRRADRLARHLRLSRSGLFTQAMKDYLRQWDANEISAKLNQVYDRATASDQRRMARRIKAKFQSNLTGRL